MCYNNDSFVISGKSVVWNWLYFISDCLLGTNVGCYGDERILDLILDGRFIVVGIEDIGIVGVELTRYSLDSSRCENLHSYSTLAKCCEF